MGENDRYTTLLEGPLVRSLFTLALPIVFANILQTAYQITDAFWIGRLGGNAVAAVSVVFPIIFLSVALGFGFSIAGSVFIAQYFGAKNEKMVNHVASQTLFITLFLSVFLSVIGYFLSPIILSFMNVPQAVFPDALIFMRVSFLGFVFTFGFTIFQSISRGIGKVVAPLYIVFGTVLLNFVLDPLFIFGWGPLPGYGVVGAAIATLGTQGIAALIGFFILFKGYSGIHIQLSKFAFDFSFLKKAFKVGFPASVEQVTRALGVTAMTFLITSFDTRVIASYGIGSNIFQLVIIPSVGFSMAVSALVGQNIGAGKIDRAASVAQIGVFVSFVVMSILGVFVFLFAPYLIRFFIHNDPEVVAIGVRFVRIMALTFGFFGGQMTLLGVFRASGNTTFTMIMALVAQWVVQFPTAFILSKYTSLGSDGIWWAFPLTNIAMFIVSFLWYKKGDWKKKNITEEEKETERVSEEIFIEEGVRD